MIFKAKCPADSPKLKTYLDLQDVIALNLSRAGQICIDVVEHTLVVTRQPAPNTMSEALQHLAAHTYHGLNWDTVFAAES